MGKEEGNSARVFFRRLSNDLLLFYVEKVKRESGLTGRLRKIIESHLCDVITRTGNSHQIQRLKHLQLSARLRRARAACEKMEKFIESMKKSCETHSERSKRYHERISAAIESYDSSEAKRISEIEAGHSRRIENFRAEIKHAEEQLAALKAETKAAEEECAASLSDLLLIKARFLRKKKLRRPRELSVSAYLLITGVLLLVAALAFNILFAPVGYGLFKSAGFMKVSRQSHRATLLNDGQVLITGGEDYKGKALASAELFNPEPGRFELIENMAEPRIGHTATLLGGGRVLIAGGRKKSGALLQVLSSAEIYSPQERQFMPVGRSMNFPRWRHEAALLDNGWVLIAGGLSKEDPLDSMEFFIPEKNIFRRAGRMTSARTDFALTPIDGGRVFIGGGKGLDNKPIGAFEVYELDNERLKLVDSGKLNYARYDLTATRLRDGRVLIAGGTADGEQGLRYAEIYDPGKKTVKPCPSAMVTRRYRHSATPLPNGYVLIAGGYLWDNPKSAELFNPFKEEFDLTDHLIRNRRNHRATLLRDGGVLITGGFTYKEGKNWILRQAEIYRKARMQ